MTLDVKTGTMEYGYNGNRPNSLVKGFKPIITNISFLASSHLFWLFVMLDYVMLCYVMLCYVVLCCVVLCYVMFCFVLFCFVLFCFVLFCFVLFCCLLEMISH